jgi:hypothetical protein
MHDSVARLACSAEVQRLLDTGSGRAAALAGFIRLFGRAQGPRKLDEALDYHDQRMLDNWLDNQDFDLRADRALTSDPERRAHYQREMDEVAARSRAVARKLLAYHAPVPVRAAVVSPVPATHVQGSATSGQTAAARHTSTGGSDDGDPAPAAQVIDFVAPEFVPDTRQYLARRHALARAQKIAELAAEGIPPRDMDLTPAPWGNCDTGIGHESILPTLSRAQVDPDPLDQIIPDPYKVAAAVPSAAGENQQRPYHRFLRKAILVMRDPAASPAQRVLSDKYLGMALPGLAAAVRAYARKADLRGFDVDGCVQHLLHKLIVAADFDLQPNPNIPHTLRTNFQTIDQAITFSNFSIQSGSHQDASRYTDRPEVEEDEDAPDPMDRAVFHAWWNDHQSGTAEDKMRAGVILDPRGPVGAGSEPADAAAFLAWDERRRADDHLEETDAERHAHQVEEEIRISNIKHKLLDALLDMPAAARDAAIRDLADHLAQHPEPLLLEMLGNDCTPRKRKTDPVTAQLLDAVRKKARLAAAEALFKPAPAQSDLDHELVRLGRMSDVTISDCRAQYIDKLYETVGGFHHRNNLRSALKTRALNKRGKFPPEVERVALLLLDTRGDQ